MKKSILNFDIIFTGARTKNRRRRKEIMCNNPSVIVLVTEPSCYYYCAGSPLTSNYLQGCVHIIIISIQRQANLPPTYCCSTGRVHLRLTRLTRLDYSSKKKKLQLLFSSPRISEQATHDRHVLNHARVLQLTKHNHANTKKTKMKNKSFCFLKLFLKETQNSQQTTNKPTSTTTTTNRTEQYSRDRRVEVNRKHLFPIGEEHLITEPPLLPPNLSCYIFC